MARDDQGGGAFIKDRGPKRRERPARTTPIHRDPKPSKAQLQGLKALSQFGPCETTTSTRSGLDGVWYIAGTVLAGLERRGWATGRGWAPRIGTITDKGREVYARATFKISNQGALPEAE